MLGKLRTRLTFANVCSFLALAVALGTGTAYAANTIGSTDIINGQVKSADIGTGQVQSVDVKNDGLTGVDIADSSLTDSEIADGSLTSANIEDGSIDGLDIRDEGVDSPDLAPESVGSRELADGAIQGHMQDPRVASTALDTTSPKEIQVPCAFGTDKATGGGFVIGGPGGANVPNVAIQRSYAVDDSHWLVRAVATSGAPSWQLTAIVTCAGG